MEINRENIEALLGTIVKRLLPLNPSKIILFGSYAYGTPTSDSDLDICVVKKQILSKTKEKREIREKLKDIEVAKDILIPSEEEYEFYRKQYGSVFMDIDMKGRVLWQNS
ncbi:nucleotidyltransferase domain-containing protein [Parabacteroides sp. FAFU027]|uniref:nucleotidyltransferase domain-containing protein n=1 Tax=Parabacteroides sp. FAFU027 TaxID=2922715 RepID=UPI001FAE91A0|nr:nucleotidyltransferase domain-containing protein [Parabacteroides sp. FAFU027]